MMRDLRTMLSVLFALGTASCAAPIAVGAMGADAAFGSQLHSGPVRTTSATAELPESRYFAEEAGKSFDRQDRAHLVAAMREMLEYGEPGTKNGWINPDNGHWGTLTFLRAYREREADACRDIDETITIGGLTRSTIVTACQKNGGPWQIVRWTIPGQI
jgi:surface antigen